MKTIIKPFIALVVMGVTVSCSELKDDNHYGKTDTEIANNELKIVDVTSEEYINGRSDLSNMNELFKSQGIYDELDKKGQLSTMLVVTNDHFKKPEDKTEFVTRSHVSDISISPANLEDGTRLMMWHGKYVNVTIDSIGKNGVIVDHILFNNGAVKEVIKTSTGYIYVISDMIETPTSLYDFINELDDDYSIFRDMVLASGGKEFDRANSKAVGINEQGNTVYDSVFIYRNTFFEAVNFDMNSESLTATMLLPSNAVIQDALNDAHQRLQSWDMVRSDSIMKDWILKSAFYSKRYAANQIQTTELQDLKSIFSTQWRTNVQKVNTAEPIELSNGIVYKITKLHLPNNLLMYRLKDYFYYYENCTDEQKATYFKAANLNFKECATEVAAWSPLPGVWPYHENRIIRFDKPSEIADADGFQLDFTPVKLNADGTVRPYLFPPGAYRFAMGSVQNQSLDIVVMILIDGQEVTRTRTIRWSTSTEFHYDRGTTLSNTHPEGYDASYVREVSGNSKAANYDTDGGQMMEELVIPDVKGDGSPVQITMRINCGNWEGKTNVKLHHWCLRPTTNNY